ncbi:hypothetical protein GPK31_02915 [Streptococcus salivarius]|jgi:hypothetical protein|uniref:hypothetical protein n=1 Tax=Streptococcus salivarius TaxID=1304 RepID=UPI001C026224|nr:hypothetical protein [Streptococcus salivarius]MBT9615044.1 hypothetical protein [Streptococcus salivarius]
MTILPFRKQKMSTNGIKPPLTQEELAELFEEAEVWKLGLDRQSDLNTPSGVVLGSSGSGKKVIVQSMEIIPTLSKNIYDR